MASDAAPNDAARPRCRRPMNNAFKPGSPAECPLKARAVAHGPRRQPNVMDSSLPSGIRCQAEGVIDSRREGGSREEGSARRAWFGKAGVAGARGGRQGSPRVVAATRAWAGGGFSRGQHRGQAAAVGDHDCAHRRRPATGAKSIPASEALPARKPGGVHMRMFHEAGPENERCIDAHRACRELAVLGNRSARLHGRSRAPRPHAGSLVKRAG
jgi:hypothetical protein